VGDDSGCGAFGTEGADPAMEEWLYANLKRGVWPEGCGFEYERAFALRGPGAVPPLVESTTILAGTEGGAVEGLAIAPSISAFLNSYGSGLTEVTAPQIGTEARLFHGNDEDSSFGNIRVKGRGPASLLAWRAGKVMASILVGGSDEALNDKAALRLARIQQSHIESPGPYTKADRYDAEVQLENPYLRFPIYWLGRAFRPAAANWTDRLFDSYASNRGTGPPGQKALVEYTGTQLGIWTRSSWRHFRRSALGGLVAHWRCTRKFRVKLRRGSAIVFAGYGKDYRRCPHRKPRLWFARAFIGRAVVTIDQPICLSCVFERPARQQSATRPRDRPFNYLRYFKAAVRALRLYPKPKY